MATKHTQATTRSSLTVVKNALQVASEAESVESLPTTHRSYPEATPSDDLRGIIIDRFLGEVRSFASEIIEGTNRYRQLQALVEHLPHDYHDRFLIELIQNAHDVSD